MFKKNVHRSSGKLHEKRFLRNRAAAPQARSGDWGTPQQARKRPAPRKREPGDFPQVYLHLHCLPVSEMEPDRNYTALWESITVIVNE